MTLSQWSKKYRWAPKKTPNGGMVVPLLLGENRAAHRDLFHLSNYRVNSVSGGSVWLGPKKTGNNPSRKRYARKNPKRSAGRRSSGFKGKLYAKDMPGWLKKRVAKFSRASKSRQNPKTTGDKLIAQWETPGGKKIQVFQGRFRGTQNYVLKGVFPKPNENYASSKKATIMKFAKLGVADDAKHGVKYKRTI